MFTNAPVGKLKIRDATSSKMFTIHGVNAQIDSENTAATQANKIFAIASMSVVGDSQTTLTIEKVVVNNG